MKTITRTQERILTYLIRNYTMHEEIKLDLFDELKPMQLNNKVTLSSYLRKLDMIGAIEIVQDTVSEFVIIVKKRPEEFMLSVGKGVTKLQRNERLGSLQQTEIQRLSSIVEELQQKLLVVELAKPVAWLWKVKGAKDWKEATKFAPTKDDMEKLEFKPLYDYPEALLANLDIWQHVKSGGKYTVVGSFSWEETNTPATAYRSLEHSTVWGRVTTVFMDGRFINLSEAERNEPKKRKKK